MNAIPSCYSLLLHHIFDPSFPPTHPPLSLHPPSSPPFLPFSMQSLISSNPAISPNPQPLSIPLFPPPLPFNHNSSLFSLPLFTKINSCSCPCFPHSSVPNSLLNLLLITTFLPLTFLPLSLSPTSSSFSITINS